MKALTVALFCLVATSAFAAKSPANDDQMIRETCAKFMESWNKHDAKSMASHWSEDGSLINPMGRVAIGRDGVAKLFQDEMNGVLKDTKAEMTVQTVRNVKPDVAFVDSELTVTGMMTPDGKAIPPAKHHVAALVVKKSARWWFVDIRPYAFVQPPGREAAASEAPAAK